MDKEKELKEHIEKRIQNYVWKVLTGQNEEFREYINSFAVHKENSTDVVDNQ
mgnify:CR=1 FL=1